MVDVDGGQLCIVTFWGTPLREGGWKCVKIIEHPLECGKTDWRVVAEGVRMPRNGFDIGTTILLGTLGTSTSYIRSRAVSFMLSSHTVVRTASLTEVLTFRKEKP